MVDRCGRLALHGAHQVAQKSTTSGFCRRSVERSGLPSRVLTVNDGAGRAAAPSGATESSATAAAMGNAGTRRNMVILGSRPRLSTSARRAETLTAKRACDASARGICHSIDRDCKLSRGVVRTSTSRRRECGCVWAACMPCASVHALSQRCGPRRVADRRDFTRKVKPMVTASMLAALPQLGAGAASSIPALIAKASPFSKAVLALLVGLSVYSWAVMWDRLRLYGRVKGQDARFLQAFRSGDSLADLRPVAMRTPLSVLAKAALAGQKASEQLTAEGVGPAARFELVQRAMDRTSDEAVSNLERHVSFLATTGSVAPFIGLMGTVWGVMVSFVNIGAQGSATLVVVAPGIAEALIATIAGLAAAIPSVIGYNHCLGKLREIGHAAAQFTSEYLDRRIGARHTGSANPTAGP